MTKEIYGNIGCSVRMVGPPQFKKDSGKQRRRSAVIMHIV